MANTPIRVLDIVCAALGYAATYVGFLLALWPALYGFRHSSEMASTSSMDVIVRLFVIPVFAGFTIAWLSSLRLSVFAFLVVVTQLLLALLMPAAQDVDMAIADRTVGALIVNGTAAALSIMAAFGASTLRSRLRERSAT